MLNIVMRLMGLGKAVDALDGETSKAYLGGVGEILSGAASLLTGSAHIVVALAAAHGVDAYLDIGKSLFHGNADTALVLAGAALVSKGLADIGNRHATAKLSAQIVQSNAVPLPNQP